MTVTGAAKNGLIRVLVVDSDQLTSTGLSSMLAGADDIEVIAEAGTGEEASRLAHLHRPGVIVSTWPLHQLLRPLRDITRPLRRSPIRFVLLTGPDDGLPSAPDLCTTVAAAIPRDGFTPCELRAVVRQGPGKVGSAS